MRANRGLFSFGLALAAILVPGTAPGASTRNYSADTTVLVVDGVQDSGVKVDLVDTQTASGTTSEATLKATRFAAGSKLAEWVTTSLSGHAATKSIQFLTVDSTFRIKQVETVRDVSIREVDFPTLDATGKDELSWTVKLTSGASTQAAGDNSQTTAHGVVKRFIESNFRFDIAGIDTSRVVKVDPIVVQIMPKPGTTTGRVSPIAGRARIPTSTSTPSSVVVYLTTSHPSSLQSFQQWLGSGAAPKSGSIAYLSPDLKTTLCTAPLGSVAVTKITTETNARARVEMTVGSVGLTCNATP